MRKNIDFGCVMEERDKPGFFKILQNENLSSETTRKIPGEFIRKISQEKGRLPFKMVLKTRWGKLWLIQISKTPKFYYMEKSGWDDFVNDNGLCENELVTFTHEENMFCTVEIYQINGEELLKPRKSSAIASSSSSSKNKTEQVKNMNIYVKIEDSDSDSDSTTVQSTRRTKNPKPEISKKSEEIENKKKKKKKKRDDVSSSSLIPEFTITITKSYLFFLGVPKRFSENHIPKETKEFSIHHKNGKKSWKVGYLVTDKQSRISAGWPRLAKEYPLVIGDVCTFKLIKPTEMLLEVSRRAKE